MAPDYLKLLIEDVSASSWYEDLSQLTAVWLADTIDALTKRMPTASITVLDPVAGHIVVMPQEQLFLDSPLLQRLRMHQMPTGHYVFPGASHERISHSLGTLGLAQQYIVALRRRASERGISLPTAGDAQAIRLAALLHNIGYGPFGEVVESLGESRMASEIALISAILHRPLSRRAGS
jgi:HD superfamily phosphohydrolase